MFEAIIYPTFIKDLICLIYGLILEMYNWKICDHRDVCHWTPYLIFPELTVTSVRGEILPDFCIVEQTFIVSVNFSLGRLYEVVKFGTQCFQNIVVNQKMDRAARRYRKERWVLKLTDDTMGIQIRKHTNYISLIRNIQRFVVRVLQRNKPIGQKDVYDK